MTAPKLVHGPPHSRLILGPSRLKLYVRARHATMAALRARGASFPQIGRWLGGRDHTSVIHGVSKFQRDATEEERLIVEALSA